MSRKDYIALADALAYTLAEHPGATAVVATAARAIANACARDNENFNRATFYRAIFGTPTLPTAP